MMNAKLKALIREQTEQTILEAAAKWPSEFLSREDVKVFSGNAISTGYLANLDCQGKGIADAFYIGRRLVYPKKSAVKWLIERVSFTPKTNARPGV